MAGTETELPRRLGIRDGNNVVVLGAPQRFSRALNRVEAVQVSQLSRHVRSLPVDVAVLFVDRVTVLERQFADVTERLHPHGGVWVAWSRRRGDVDESTVRRIGLAAGMTQTRVLEIDDSWWGMRLVLREENRDAVAYRASPRLLAPRRATARARRASAVGSGGGAGSSLTRARARASK